MEIFLNPFDVTGFCYDGIDSMTRCTSKAYMTAKSMAINRIIHIKMQQYRNPYKMRKIYPQELSLNLAIYLLPYEDISKANSTMTRIRYQTRCSLKLCKRKYSQTEKNYLILPNVEKIVCVTNIDGFDDTLGSANHLDGTPLNTIVSGSLLPPLG